MDKKPYTPPTFSPIPIPDSPLPLMVSGLKVKMRRSRQTPKKILGIPTHFGMMMPTLDNTTTGENSTSRFPRISFYDGNHLSPHEYYYSQVSHVCDMLTENKLICRQVDSPSKKDDSMSNSVLTCQLFSLLTL